MAELAHSKLGASSMERWSTCAPSVRLSEGMPEIKSKYAEEGTLAHEHAAYYLENRKWRDDLEMEMRDAVQTYTGVVLSDLSAAGADAKLFVEKRFDLSKVYPGLFGTSDAVLYEPKHKLLRVYDYKHGQGIAVDVEQNVQLMYYGLGALLEIGLPAEDVELVIVQPRCYHKNGPVRRWNLPATDLIDFAADLAEYAKRTEDPNAPIVPGDHCRFCRAAPKCPAMVDKATSLAKLAFSPVEKSKPDESEQLGQLLPWLDTLEDWIKNVRQYAYHEAEHGRPPKGWKLVQKVARRKWRSETEVLNRVREKNLKAEDFIVIKKEIKTAPAVEKEMGKDVFALFSDLVVAESSGTTLVPESDKRPAVQTGPNFEKIENQASDIDALL